ncbi:hypothetical protein KXR76_03650 [Mammaliicoccus vitulinus]
MPVLAKLHIEHIYVSKMDKTYKTIESYINACKINITYHSSFNACILSNLTVIDDLCVYNSITTHQHTLIVTHGNIMT